MSNLDRVKLFWYFFKLEFRKGTHLIYLHEARYALLGWGLISLFVTTRDYIFGEISTTLFVALSLVSYAIIQLPFQYEIKKQMAIEKENPVLLNSEEVTT